MKTLALFILTIAISISACADPAANKPRAETTEPVTANLPKVESIKSDSGLEIKAKGTAIPFDSNGSKIEFVGSKVTGKHEGGFKAFKGIVDLVNDNADESSVVFEIDMSTVYTDTDGLTKHLQTGDFFEVEKYPTSKFTSAKITKDSAKGSDSYIVEGNLEMRGVTKTLKFPATISITPTDISVKSEFSINRKDFGIVYAGKADDLIRDDVVIRLVLKAPKTK